MSKRVICRVGDIIAIPVNEGAFALAAVTYVSKYFKNCIAVGIFPNLIQDISAPVVMPNRFELYPLFTGKQAVAAAIWPRVAHLPLPSPYDTPPEFVAADEIYKGDTPLRIATPDDLKSVPKLLAYGCTAVESKLKRHFNAQMFQEQTP